MAHCAELSYGTLCGTLCSAMFGAARQNESKKLRGLESGTAVDHFSFVAVPAAAVEATAAVVIDGAAASIGHSALVGKE